jgi:hypothetical protein
MGGESRTMSMGLSIRRAVLSVGVVLTLLLPLFPAQAGTITVAWDPVSDPGLTGYRLYYGAASGSYSESLDVGLVTEHTVNGLADCTTYFMAIKSLDADSLESPVFSDEVSGFVRPTVASVSPNLVLADSTQQFTVTGNSFEPGTNLAFSQPGVTASDVTVDACGQISATLVVDAAAPAGPVDVTVINPGDVPTTLTGAFSVTQDPGPAVAVVDPPDGAQDVHPSTAVTVTFDRNLLSNSVTQSSVLLLNESGVLVTQVATSPSLAGNVVTLLFTTALAEGAVYRVQVIGGPSGVKDVSGIPMVSTFTQPTGFRIAGLPPPDVPNLHRTDLIGSP